MLTSTQRKGTFQFDLTEGILKPFVLDNSSYEPGPSNVDAGFIAYHDSLAQILPLTWAIWDEFDPSVCDDVCVRGRAVDSSAATAAWERSK